MSCLKGGGLLVDEIRKIIVEAGKKLKGKYFSSFMIEEKEKGHLAADVDMEVELFLKCRTASCSLLKA